MYNIRLGWDIPLKRQSIVRQIDFTISNGLVYPLTVSGFGIGIKMGKNFYLQQKQNEQLAKEKINAEVKLSKSQIHPRFLFHSLNSIYHDMLTGSEKSPTMLLKLSDLLSYILYESNEKLVPLQKELAFLENYIELEKISWGDKLVMDIRNDISTEEKFITPMLLLPLAEYFFELADKNKLQKGSLKINMIKNQNTFMFSFMMDGFPGITNPLLEENVQLLQVQKRLHALYPQKHDYKTVIGKNEIQISLSLLLDS